FFLCQLLWFEDHHKFLERAREPKGHFVHVVLNHWSASVFANIEGFIQGETHPHRLRNPPLRHLPAVHEQPAGGAFPDTTSVVREIQAPHVIASRERLVRNDAELVLTLIGKGVGKLRFAVLQQQRVRGLQGLLGLRSALRRPSPLPSPAWRGGKMPSLEAYSVWQPLRSPGSAWAILIRIDFDRLLKSSGCRA